MRVLELSDREEAAAFCGKLFARWGAEVIRVESPDRAPPTEALDRYLNGGKRRVALDYRDAEQRETLDRLAATCDVMITDASAHDVERFDLMQLGAASGHIVRTSITPFGLSGPYRDWQATASTLLALGGYTWLHGDIGRTPLTMPGNYPYYQTGSYAYVAALSSQLRARANPDAGPTNIEVSVLEALGSLHQFTFETFTYGGRIRSRHGNRWENLHPTTLLPCADGWWSVNVLDQFWEPFAMMIDRPDVINDPRFATNADRLLHADELDEIIIEAVRDWPMKRVLKDGQETWRVPVGYMMSTQDALDDPHMNERGFWRSADDGPRTAGSPFLFIGEEPPAERAPSAIGAHTAEVLSELPDAPAGTSTAAAPAAALTSGAMRPLEGVRVVDLTRIWSGPLGARMLGDLGAEVVKIEAHTNRGPAVVPGVRAGLFPDGDPGERPWNRSGMINERNRNKQSVALDLKSERGRELFLQLVAEADIVIENFSARAMPSLGLGYEQLRTVNDGIIYVAMPAFGLTGPYRDYVGLGPSIEPLIGLTALMGYSEDEPRVTAKALTDAISGVVAASAAVTALDRREQTGQGAFIDLSQHEAGVTMLGEYFIDRQVSGVEPPREGNWHPEATPHGVFRCAGDDDWIALSVGSEAQWLALAESAGAAWPSDARFATAEARREHRAALNETIERWTATRDKFELMRTLQAAGIAAGVVHTAPEVLADPHLDDRGYWVHLDDVDAGRQRYDGSPLIFNGERGYDGWAPAPTLGGQNESVLRDLLGVDADDFAALHEQGVIADRPPG